jgi:YVTN family beta-propeller protein
LKIKLSPKINGLSFFVSAFLLFADPLMAEPYAFITNQLDNSVSVIETHSQKVIKTVTVTGKPVGVAVNNVNQ